MGGGDPNLSARAIPYRMGPLTGNPLAAIDDLARQIAARGVKRVDGDIIGDDTWYLWQPYATGWSIDDPQSDDGPPISALTLADNVITLQIHPGANVGTSRRFRCCPQPSSTGSRIAYARWRRAASGGSISSGYRGAGRQCYGARFRCAIAGRTC